jgi:hypothetical protein
VIIFVVHKPQSAFKMKEFLICIIMLMACVVVKAHTTEEEQNLSISVKSVFGKSPLTIGSEKYVTSNGDTVQIDRFRCYLSGFEVQYENGVRYQVKDYYHLLDIEIENSQNILLKKIPSGKIVSIKFNIGVDSIKSVSGAQGGDLDPANGMYWAWNSGYINAKLEGRSNVCATHLHAFEFHIGGYSRPNNSLREVTLTLAPGKNTDKIILKADVSCWFEGIDLKTFNGIMIPGKEAMKMATKYQKMFSVVTE